ncbi:AraC family transcriptional regulator N-terminal domain-containing protein [Paraburkholderia caballeronis]|uniref:AraC family transcriptional regulator N-terminal domain-containing protein n=1 Tax=Paraburkholderia caballeronis TaxID=416943 RepID=UPI003132DBF0
MPGRAVVVGRREPNGRNAFANATVTLRGCADAWVRMRRLIERPDDIAVLAPLIGRKILSRPARRKRGTATADTGR